MEVWIIGDWDIVRVDGYEFLYRDLIDRFGIGLGLFF